MKSLVLLLVIHSSTGQFNLPSVPKLKVPKVDLSDLSLDKLLPKQFDDFKNTFHKTYKSAEEEITRKNIFAQKRKEIDVFNKLFELGNSTFLQKLTPFTDLLNGEFNKLLNGFNRHPEKKKPLPEPPVFQPTKAEIPENMDWRERGAVTPVKNQGFCAGCYAFSAAGALEAQYFKKTGKLIELSPQNIVDCSESLGNTACDGGYVDSSFQFVKQNKGLNQLDAYPYQAKAGEKCQFQSEGATAECKGYVAIPSGDENALKIAVATEGPVSAAIDASQESFQNYGSGVYYDKNCKNKLEDLNHAILIVGYGVEPNGDLYWLVKNSYSDLWGIDGYVKIARNKNNHCGIATWAMYPQI